MLYTHGFEDTNVKNAVGIPFFNDLKSPHLGLFGHWVHQHPPRADTEVLFLGWMDQDVKGKKLGFERLAQALVVNDEAAEHELDGWPSRQARSVDLYPDFSSGTLATRAAKGNGQVILEPTGAANSTPEDLIRLETNSISRRNLPGLRV